MNRVLLLLTFLFLSLSYCKKSSPPGLFFGYVTSPNGVQLYNSPGEFKNKGTILKEDESFQVLKDRIPDPKLGDKKFWYEVQSSQGSKGFMSYDESLVHKTVSIFHKAIPEKSWGVVTASNLNVRERPDLTSKSLLQIPQFSLVKILSEGSLSEKIKGAQGNWLEIETTDGKKGFAFSAFVNLYNQEQANQAIARKEISLTGYFLVQKNPKFTEFPQGPEVRSIPSEDSCNSTDTKYFPAKDEFGKVTSVAEVSGKKFYLIEMYEIMGYECGMYATGWIESSYGTFYSPFEFEEYTLKSAHPSFTSQDIAAIRSNAEWSGGIDFKNSSLETIPLDNGSSSVFLVRLAMGTATAKGSGDQYYVQSILKRGESSSAIIAQTIYGNLTFRDLDGDSYPEILAVTSERGGNYSILYGFKNGKYENILDSSYDGYEGKDITFESDNSIKVIKYKYENDQPKQEEESFRYSKGILKKM